jgi:hypothetical protein
MSWQLAEEKAKKKARKNLLKGNHQRLRKQMIQGGDKVHGPWV